MPLNTHLRKLWLDAGYLKGTGSAAVTPPPPAGYRRVYHLTSADHAISNIVFARLKVARLSQLNDPFEFWALRTRSKTIRKVLTAHKNKLDSKKGLLCFSADWINPVLWTHYGARHTG